MIFPAAFTLSIKNFSRKYRKGRKTLHLSNAVLGIALSLIPLILVIVVANGMIEGITRRYIEVASYHIRMMQYEDVTPGEAEEIVNRVRGLPGVEAAVPVRQGVGVLYSENRQSGVGIRGVPGDVLIKDVQFGHYMEIKEGAFDLGSKDSICISSALAKKLEVSVGSPLKLLSARSFPGRPPILRASNFTVKGIFSSGYQELDASLAYVSMDIGNTLFREQDSFFLGVKIQDPFIGIDSMVAFLYQETGGEWRVYPWYELERSMFSSFSTTKNLLLFIMIIIVVVASMNISSTLLMLYLEKRSEIAVLKSTGAESRVITLSFLITGFIIGVLGLFFGITGGLLLSLNINEVIHGIEWIVQSVFQPFLSYLRDSEAPSDTFRLLNPSYYLEYIPINIRFSELFTVSGMVISLSLIASYFPARKAGKMKPLEVMSKQG